MTDTYGTLRDMPDDVRARLDEGLFHGMREREEKAKRGAGEEVSIDPIVLNLLTYSTLVIKCC